MDGVHKKLGKKHVPQKCNLCGTTLTRLAILRRHLINVHKMSKDKVALTMKQEPSEEADVKEIDIEGTVCKSE